ncbi:MAG: hypothetical protein OXT71_00300 [Acidobacteriota bacterium]|nr:hypothetical protein [Acidobacteriota bacterium]
MKTLELKSGEIQSAGAILRAVESILGNEQKTPVVVVPAMGLTRKQFLEAGRKAADQDMVVATTLAEGLRTYHMQVARQLTSGTNWSEALRRLGLIFQDVTDLLKGLHLLGEVSPRAELVATFYGQSLAATILAHSLKERDREARALVERSLAIHPNKSSLEEQVGGLLAEGTIPVLPRGLAKRISEGS